MLQLLILASAGSLLQNSRTITLTNGSKFLHHHLPRQPNWPSPGKTPYEVLERETSTEQIDPVLSTRAHQVHAAHEANAAICGPEKPGLLAVAPQLRYVQPTAGPGKSREQQTPHVTRSVPAPANPLTPETRAPAPQPAAGPRSLPRLARGAATSPKGTAEQPPRRGHRGRPRGCARRCEGGGAEPGRVAARPGPPGSGPKPRRRATRPAEPRAPRPLPTSSARRAPASRRHMTLGRRVARQQRACRSGAAREDGDGGGAGAARRAAAAARP